MNHFRGEYGEFAAGILLFSEISPLDEDFLNNIHRCNLSTQMIEKLISLFYNMVIKQSNGETE